MSELYLVGIGPGGREHMTGAALAALEAAEVVVGYARYIDLLRPVIGDKRTFTTPMTMERERCLWAVEEAKKGRRVAVVCSGDAGVYGMAGPVLELTQDCPEVEVIVVPGVTAALSGAALLGAPLMNDFCVLSLSDRLTPWEVIEARLRAAVSGDFVIVLYNPSSRGRRDHLKRACGIIMETRPAETVCGIARNIGRDGEESLVLTLEELSRTETDMFTTVFVGNSRTMRAGNRMTVSRGYEVKE